ncbi:MAG: sodium:proton antiporter [Clostridiales Family XIII bacterium]|nr:sodium:proton antiporter [Clostridiales Family XIII bacterium]
MELTTIIIILLFAIVVSILADSAFPRLPLPFIQIVCGVLLTLTPLDENLTLEPEAFMALLVAPLLFREAEEADLVGLFRVRRPVIFMAFLLVFVTVFSIGFSVHALMPALPLALCFALGAILGPTDAIAVSSISSRVDIDDKIMAILKGEGLINDASGVISFHFAVAALLTGSFSFPMATLKFIIVCGGGFLVGFSLSFAKEVVARRLLRMNLRSNAAFMLIEILTPFICYLAAETVEVSGIIAAVTAGSHQALKVHRIGLFEVEFSMFKKSLWEMLTVTFNALVFLLLGLQLPGIVENVVALHKFSVGSALGLAGLATLILFSVRFVSVLFAANKVTGSRVKQKLKNSLILTLSGVKGTVSLATAFSLPFFFQSEGDFPYRDLILFVAAAAIIFSLLLAMIILPRIADPKAEYRKNEKHIMVLRELLSEISHGNGAYSAAIILNIRGRIDELEHEDLGRKGKKLKSELREFSAKTEMRIMEGKYKRGEITRNEYRHYLRILLAVSHLASQSIIGRIGMRHHSLGRFFDRFEAKDSSMQEGEKLLEELDAEQSSRGGSGTSKCEKRRAEDWRRGIAKSEDRRISMQKLQDIFWANTSDVIMALESKRDKRSDAIVSGLIDERIYLAGQVMEGVYGEEAKGRLHCDYDEELLQCFDLEREIVKRRTASGTLTEDEADKIRIDINMVETVMLEDSRNDNIRKLLAAGIRRRD